MISNYVLCMLVSFLVRAEAQTPPAVEAVQKDGVSTLQIGWQSEDLTRRSVVSISPRLQVGAIADVEAALASLRADVATINADQDLAARVDALTTDVAELQTTALG